MIEELKPCPFCGGDAELQDDIGREDRVFYRSVCADIECQGHYCNDWSMTQERAIERWNTRAERTCKNRGSYMGCSECGWYLNENDRYCGGCGAKVVE